MQSQAPATSVPILMYHSIDTDGPPELADYRVSPVTFEQQLRYLAEHGFYSLSLEEWGASIGAGRAPRGRPVILTFDDGYVNFREQAWPLLQRFGFTATLFVVTDKAGTQADWDTLRGEHLPLLDWPALRELYAAGVAIGSHTATHPSLPELPRESVIEQGLRSRQRLRDELGADVTSLAYPWGRSNETVRAAMGEAGFRTAVTTWGGVSTLKHPPMELPRIEVFPSDDLDAFARKLRVNQTDVAAPHAPAPKRTARMPADHNDFFAARLDALIGGFISLSQDLLAAGGRSDSLQQSLTRLFRQPIAGPVTQSLAPYETLPSGACVGFEATGRVSLAMEPKSDHGSSPESCVNRLSLTLTGPSRWLSLEFTCEWPQISRAQRYQLGLYGRVSHKVPGRAVLRLPAKDGSYQDLVFARFELLPERRNLNMAGEIPRFDYVSIDTQRRPTLLFDMDTTPLGEFVLELHYLSLYVD